MTDCETFDDLATSIQNDGSAILEKTVAPLVKDILLKHIQSDIYDTYTPIENGWVDSNGTATTYERRNTLTNPDNITYDLSEVGTLLVTSSALPSPSIGKKKFFSTQDGAFLRMLAGSKHGLWRHGFPRPAVVNAQQEVNKSAAIKTAIANALKNL